MAPLTGWVAGRQWISARPSRGGETPCTSATPACSSWPWRRRVSLTACRGRQRHVCVTVAELDGHIDCVQICQVYIQEKGINFSPSDGTGVNVKLHVSTFYNISFD